MIEDLANKLEWKIKTLNAKNV